MTAPAFGKMLPGALRRGEGGAGLSLVAGVREDATGSLDRGWRGRARTWRQREPGRFGLARAREGRVNIQGRIVTLRAIEERDLESLHKWSNDPVTQAGIGEAHFPSSMDFHTAWFHDLKSDPLSQRFAVEEPEAGLIGISTLMTIDWRNRHAWHGLVLGEREQRRKGPAPRR